MNFFVFGKGYRGHAGDMEVLIEIWIPVLTTLKTDTQNACERRKTTIMPFTRQKKHSPSCDVVVKELFKATFLIPKKVLTSKLRQKAANMLPDLKYLANDVNVSFPDDFDSHSMFCWNTDGSASFYDIPKAMTRDETRSMENGMVIGFELEPYVFPIAVYPPMSVNDKIPGKIMISADWFMTVECVKRKAVEQMKIAQECSHTNKDISGSFALYGQRFNNDYIVMDDESKQLFEYFQDGHLLFKNIWKRNRSNGHFVENWRMPVTLNLTCRAH